MNPFLKLKIGIDLLMTVGLLLSMSYLLIGKTFHEFNGAFLLVLIIVHNVLNRKWYKGLFSGRYRAVRIYQTVINILMFLAVFCSILTGIILSQVVFGFIPASGLTGFARALHLPAVYWSFTLISMHLGLHWGLILGLINRATGQKTSSRVGVWVLRLLGFIIVIIGIRAFIKHDLWSYMTMQNQFVFFDVDQHLVFFFAEYIAMITMWAWISYYLKKLIEKVEGRQKQKSKFEMSLDNL